MAVPDKMSLGEVKSTLILASIFALRMLGLFMVLPVLALYAQTMPYATPALIGLAAGIYGLTQALFQLPYGMLSDRLGRKPVILGGLSVFAAGSIVAALSTSVWGLIIGRAIQGAGAIGSPIMALAADVTREEVRTRAMAIIGISIGITFTVAILLGPWLDSKIGLSGIFSLTAVLAVGGMGLLFCMRSQQVFEKASTFSASFRDLTKRSDLWLLNVSIFVLHALFIASFQVLPLQIQTVTGLSGAQVWKFYLPVLVISLLIVAPFLRQADNPLRQKKFMQLAMLGLGITVPAFIYATQLSLLVIAVILFFVAFNFLEACLPALVSRAAPKTSKGAALGIYSSAQFLGMFCGGALGGVVLQTLGSSAIGICCAALAIIGWLTLRGSNHGKRG